MVRKREVARARLPEFNPALPLIDWDVFSEKLDGMVVEKDKPLPIQLVDRQRRVHLIVFSTPGVLSKERLEALAESCNNKKMRRGTYPVVPKPKRRKKYVHISKYPHSKPPRKPR